MGMIMKKLNLFAGIAIALSGLFASQTFAASGCISAACDPAAAAAACDPAAPAAADPAADPAQRKAFLVTFPPHAPRPPHAIRLPPLPAMPVATPAATQVATLDANPVAFPKPLAAEPAPIAAALAATVFANVMDALKFPLEN